MNRSVRRFSETQIKDIRTAVEQGCSMYSIAKLLGVGHNTISCIVKRYTYKDVA